MSKSRGRRFFAAFFVAPSLSDKNLSTNRLFVDNFPFCTAIFRAKKRIFVAKNF